MSVPSSTICSSLNSVFHLGIISSFIVLLKNRPNCSFFNSKWEFTVFESNTPSLKGVPEAIEAPVEDSKVNEAKKNTGKKLSKETLAKIRKVALKKGYSFASLKQEYIKGLGAYYSSGSRPGMTAHQWAMARVNAASPSKSWANVKKADK